MFPFTNHTHLETQVAYWTNEITLLDFHLAQEYIQYSLKTTLVYILSLLSPNKVLPGLELPVLKTSLKMSFALSAFYVMVIFT